MKIASRRFVQAVTAPLAKRQAPRRVLFMHIPKTAGTSIHHHFVQLLGRLWRGQVAMIGDREQPPQLALAEGARYVGGHFGGIQLSRVRRDAYAFTFLRDPLDRVVSTWRYATTTKAGTATNRFDSLETALGSDDPQVLEGFDNVIARQLAAAYAYDHAARVPRDEWVDRALATLDSLDHVGTLDTIEADFETICQGIGITAPPKLGRHNATDDAERKNRQGTGMPDTIEQTARLKQVAEPWIALDRAVLDAWKAKAAGRGTDPR